LLESFDTILFGPGCSISDYTYQVLHYIIEHWNKPAIIDADGLNSLSQHPDLLKKLVGKPFVLTPHWGEFCRLAKIDLQALEQDCLSELKDFVEAYHLKVLLKSHTSIYYDSKTMYVNTNGNDGLATGGSGDILSGLIAGFLAQNLDFGLAAGSAAFYLGRTAEKLAEIQPAFSITPSDILDNIFIYDLEDEQDEN
ncbi:MAG: ADP/ATP-dependent (S)-NAD(P)H-hydrate dehydratase, partial [Candidatus Cloacimonadaceae bacterium]